MSKSQCIRPFELAVPLLGIYPVDMLAQHMYETTSAWDVHHGTVCKRRETLYVFTDGGAAKQSIQCTHMTKHYAILEVEKLSKILCFKIKCKKKKKKQCAECISYANYLCKKGRKK